MERGTETFTRTVPQRLGLLATLIASLLIVLYPRPVYYQWVSQDELSDNGVSRIISGEVAERQKYPTERRLVLEYWRARQRGPCRLSAHGDRACPCMADRVRVRLGGAPYREHVMSHGC